MCRGSGQDGRGPPVFFFNDAPNQGKDDHGDVQQYAKVRKGGDIGRAVVKPQKFHQAKPFFDRVGRWHGQCVQSIGHGRWGYVF